ncbi:hypothetical protein [Bacillus testis]|uniref:hypothetical protein n=1 Tax=Bacillus testis TaxID=1622072 RepID=UPI000B0BCD9D|nr:hypothetical protein [Bacillus testis]
MSYLVDRGKTFKDSNVIYLVISNLIAGGISGSIPFPSSAYYIVVAFITFIEIGICRYWWSHTTDNDTKYNDLTVFLMLITIGVMSCIPLFRLTLHSTLFFSVLAIYLIVFSISFYKRREMLKSFINPQGSKLVLGLSVFMVVLIIIGNLSFRKGEEQILALLMGENIAIFWGCFLMFLLGLFFTFLAPPFLATKGKFKKGGGY